MDCLFCNTHYDNQVRFSDIFFLTPLKQSICKECKAGFEAIDERHCPRCFKAHHQGVCSDCKAWEKEGYLVNHKTLYRYNSQMKAYFSRFKFQGDYLLASLFQEEIKQALKAYKGYTIVAIPLGKKRYEERQFNQVLALLEGSGYRHQELLGKHDSQKQSSKGKKERLMGDNPFYLQKDEQLPEKVLLVDDIYTTGATLYDAITVLRKNGIKMIKTFSLAR